MGHLIPAGTGLPAYRNLRIDTLGAEMEKLSPEEAAKLVEGVALPAPEITSEAKTEEPTEAPAAEAPSKEEEAG